MSGVPGVPRSGEEDGTLPGLLEHLARVHGDAPALVDGGETVGFAAPAERVRRLAAGLAALGMGPGEARALGTWPGFHGIDFLGMLTEIAGHQVTHANLADEMLRRILEAAGSPRTSRAGGGPRSAPSPPPTRPSAWRRRRLLPYGRPRPHPRRP